MSQNCDKKNVLYFECSYNNSSDEYPLRINGYTNSLTFTFDTEPVSSIFHINRRSQYNLFSTISGDALFKELNDVFGVEFKDQIVNNYGKEISL